MTDTELLALAKKEGFTAAVIDTKDVPVDGKFRKFCEDDLCGQYNKNYSCPPTCGTVEELHARILAGTKALVLKSEWPINGYSDKEGIHTAKCSHNNAMLRLNENLTGVIAGGSCCSLCNPCRMAQGEDCLHPDLRFSCMSAYCVDVAELAKRCGMDFSWDETRLYVYGMIVL